MDQPCKRASTVPYSRCVKLHIGRLWPTHFVHLSVCKCGCRRTPSSCKIDLRGLYANPNVFQGSEIFNSVPLIDNATMAESISPIRINPSLSIRELYGAFSRFVAWQLIATRRNIALRDWTRNAAKIWLDYTQLVASCLFALGSNRQRDYIKTGVWSVTRSTE